ncbi:hypothetical protein XELAEV_18011023mg [Xenopus laevis]|uniref:Uncharacterized protein n=1 Tax=Xenopus laevis TaxID=8355 RepID=A0A974DVC0_XENLA|nr:hypothetical protein XELAEV_18011023mg [Xenopus laevis]
MEPFNGRQNLGCRACGAPVLPRTLPNHIGNAYSDLVPVVSTSVLLSTFYPQFTGKNLESKITSGDIYRGFRNSHGGQTALPGHSDMTRSKWVFPELHSRTITVKPRRLNNPNGPTPRFFADLEQLQRQLISGPSRRQFALPPSSEMKSIKSLTNADPSEARDCRSKDVFFPPVLDVWAQNDAMQRSLRQQR